MASALDVAAALQYVGDDRDLLAELLTVFIEEAPGHLQALRRAVERDPAALMIAAHTLKGSLGVLGAASATALAEQLERLGHAGSLDGAGDLLARLEPEMRRVLQCAVELTGSAEPSGR